MSQGVLTVSEVLIVSTALEAVHNFCYLGSNILDNLFLDDNLSSHIGKAATTFSQLTKCMGDNRKLTLNIEKWIYQM